MDRFRLSFRAEASAAWEKVEALEAAGAESVGIVPVEARAELGEPAPGTLPLAGSVRVEALYASRAAAESAAVAIGGGGCSIEFVPERDWVAAGRSGFVPRRYGERLWVVPDWYEPPEPDAVNVVLAPGLAFGTGEHPSTSLCLELLARADLAGRTVVDYGSGSGVLAVAAMRLGAARVAAVDNDPQALAATRANAARNGVAVAVTPPGGLEATGADLLIANILARPLISLAADLCALVRPGGRIVLAGITRAQTDVVAAAYLPRARPAARLAQGDWSLLELEKAGTGKRE